MTDNQTTELKSLSKLKMAGRLRYWRGTIEIPEAELHAICDEIQAEYDNAVHALNKAAGNWAKADVELREKEGEMSGNRTTELTSCEVVRLDGVEVQENGIIRDARGWIIGRADTEWMRYQWRMTVAGICPCCGREVDGDDDD